MPGGGVKICTPVYYKLFCSMSGTVMGGGIVLAFESLQYFGGKCGNLTWEMSQRDSKTRPCCLELCT